LSNFDSFEKGGKNVIFVRKDYSDIEFEKCRNGDFTFKVNQNGKSVYAHSKYNPVREAEKFAQSLKFKKGSILVIFGFGLGYFVREIIKSFGPQNFIVIYEPDNAVFSKVVDSGLCDDIFQNERVYVISGGDYNALNSFFQITIDENVYMRCKTFVTPTYKELYIDEQVKFFKIIKKLMDINSVTRNTTWFFAESWMKNSYCNFENTLSSYSLFDMRGIFEGKTAVVVSAGPSLKKNMALLKEIKGKIPIISVFVAAKVIMENGIIPDFIVSVDSNQAGMKEGIYDKIPLIYIPSISKGFIDAHKGKHIIKVTNVNGLEAFVFSKYKYGNEFYTISGGGSVACDCAAIAASWGIKNIIFVGQDLAYTDNLLHVEGTEHDIKDIDELDRDMFEVPAVGGSTVLTDTVFMYYINWFEKFASINKHRFNLIDATEGGALIKNTEVMTLREAIDKYCVDADVDNVIKDFFDKGPVFSKEEKETILNDFYNEFEELDGIIKIVEEQKVLFEKYIKYLKFSSNIKSAVKIERQLDEYDKKIEKSKKKIEMLLNLGKNINDANKLLSVTRKEYNDNPIIEGALTRNEWLLEFEAVLKSLKALREEIENG